VLTLDGVVDDCLDIAVAIEALPQRIIVVVVVLGGVAYGIQDVLAGAVAVGGVDLFLRRPTQVLEVVIDNALVGSGSV
jgi:hypothetical protein